MDADDTGTSDYLQTIRKQLETSKHAEEVVK